MDTAQVTGAAGFAGSHLVEKPIQGGLIVRCLDDFSTGGRENLESVPENAKQVGLQISERSGTAVIILRYFNVFGSRQDSSGQYAAVIPKFIELMASGERPVVFGDGEQSRDFVYVSDVVETNMLTAESEFAGVLNVVWGKQKTINKFIELVNNILAIDLEPVYDDPRPGEIRHSVGDISKSVDRIGYEPDVELKEELKRTVDYFQ
ncbi:NAD-dependent epimerase/dehydratase family protein [Natronosalvus amylolyticus]|uniref:NAD-dependent epimerase/dehydratase family protein n=1 Tax=Natronosalvus amylolyticus TaxID=2961994 RepID=UPI0020C9E839|nr:NAD-dependent epimerase/dehydratase family protein [Natronosalvus amylolyticus]